MSDAEVLSVRFEADVKALNDALKAVDAKVSALEKGVDKSGRHIKRGFDDMRISSEALSRGIGIAMGAAVAAIIKFSQEAAVIGKNAAAVGLTTQRYQELAAAARAAGGSNDQFAAGIERATVNIAALKTRQGESPPQCLPSYRYTLVPKRCLQAGLSQPGGNCFVLMVESIPGIADPPC